MVRYLFDPAVTLHFAFDPSNVYILLQLLLFNWLVMILIYLSELLFHKLVSLVVGTIHQIGIALISYFTYTWLFIIISIVSSLVCHNG